MNRQNLLEIDGLKTIFSTENGPVTAVDGISFSIAPGETLGVVGESGCGKSVTAESIMRLLNEKSTRYEGAVNFKGENLLALPEHKMRDIRGNEVSMIFQDAMTSLNPVYTIGNQISESIMIHQNLNAKQAMEKSIEMLKLTGIPSPEKRVHEYPHEISGGMRQRVMIAMALSCKPSLLIADEPTTALDVTIQAQIIDLINDLKHESNMSVMMITHDLGVVAEVCTRVVVMYLGQVIEEADVDSLFTKPLHPYTKGLIKSIPRIDGDRTQKLHMIPGTVPSLSNIPKGCRFAPRCAFADEKCLNEAPVLEAANESQKVRCWHYEKIENGGALQHEAVGYGN